MFKVTIKQNTLYKVMNIR